jgi:hypothetical protein
MNTHQRIFPAGLFATWPERGTTRRSFRSLPSLLSVLAALSLAEPSLQAQVTAPVAPAEADSARPIPVETGSASSSDRTDLVTLDPFVVNTDKDNGFMATNAGTATKLGLDLRDLAAPYSVMTGEFIKAIGITNINEAALWATNGAPVIDGQGGDTFNANGGARINKGGTLYFARGVITNAGQQRNYFLNASTNDAYNVERIDFGRGPNAVLFNVGANSVLGGGISTVGKRARVDGNFETLSFTAGSWDYYRSTLDVNKVLSDRFALRANLLYQKRNGWQDGEQDDRKGITLAGTWRISEKSELNVEVRNDKLDRSRPPVPFGDNLSAWNGTTVVNGPITDFQYDGKAALAGTSQTLQQLPGGISGQGRFEGIWRMGDTYVYDAASGSVMNWVNMGSTRRGDEDPWVPIYFSGQAWSRGGNDQLLPIGNYGATGGNTAFRSNPFDNGGAAAFTDMTNLPMDRFSKQLAGSRLTIPGPRDAMLPAAPIYREGTKEAFLNFTHRFSGNLFFELQADVNETAIDVIGPNTVLNSRVLFIDVNRNLPNATPNPHFLDAYSQATIDRGVSQVEHTGVRAALAYTKDLGKWGHYTFNLSGMFTTRDIDSQRLNLALPINGDPRDWHSYPLQVRYYQHDESRPYQISTTSTPFFQRSYVAGASGADNTYTTSSGSIVPRWVLVNIAGQGAEQRRERNKSMVFAFAGRWFDNKLVISPGVRVSWQDTYQRWLKIAPGWGALPTNPNWDALTPLDDSYWRPDAPADWKTLTWTPRDASGNSLTPGPILSNWSTRPRVLVPGTRDVFGPNPLYNNPSDRFRDDYNRPAIRNQKDINTTLGVTYHLRDWVALKLSYGTSFLPPDVGRFLLDDTDADSERGIAYDAALTFSLFDGRLSVTPRYYFNRREKALTGSPAANAINNLMDIRAWNETYPGQRNPFNYPGINGSDYLSQYNDGYELEVGGAITRGWRLSGSFGTAQVVDYERWPLTQGYIRSRKEEFTQALEAAGGMIDPSRKPLNGSREVTDAPGLAVPNPAISDAMIQAVTLVDGTKGDPQRRTNAVNNYNTLWANYDQVSTQTDSLGLRRMSAKLVTDYTIQAGALKGFRYGAAIYYVDRDRAGVRGADTIPNPNYNANQPVSSTNRPWVDDPSVDSNTIIWVKRPFEVTGMFGYTRRLQGGGWLNGKQLEVQLLVRNLLNGREVYWQDDGVTLRPPNGDINAPSRVAVPGRIAQYQRPINYELTATIRF